MALLLLFMYETYKLNSMSITTVTSININIVVTRNAPLRLVLGHGAVVGDEGEPEVGHHGGQDGPAEMGTMHSNIFKIHQKFWILTELYILETPLRGRF